MNNWVKIGEASKIIGVHPRTLYNWENKGLIETKRTEGGMRLFNVEKYITEKKCDYNKECIEKLKELENIKDKINILYARVSTPNQKDDLERQKRMLKKKYPEYILIEDIGRGMNLNKPGIKKIIHLGIERKINKVVVAYKDRLARFGYELIEDIIKEYSKGEIEIINKEEDTNPEEEITKDIMMIMNVYISKMNGLRKYNNKKEYD